MRAPSEPAGRQGGTRTSEGFAQQSPQKCHATVEAPSRRVPTPKSAPYFMRERFRHNFTVALQERWVGEERAWRAFGLAPAMLLHKPKGVGSIGRVELMERANKFGRAVGRFVGRTLPFHSQQQACGDSQQGLHMGRPTHGRERCGTKKTRGGSVQSGEVGPSATGFDRCNTGPWNI